MKYSDYIVTIDENGQPYIEHVSWGGVKSSVKGAANRAHKYLLKVGEGVKAQYAYTKEEVDRLLGRGRQKVKDVTGATAKEKRDKAYADMVRSSRDAGRAQTRAASSAVNAAKLDSVRREAIEQKQAARVNALSAINNNYNAGITDNHAKAALRDAGRDYQNAKDNASKWITTNKDYEALDAAKEKYDRALDDRRRAMSERKIAEKEEKEAISKYDHAEHDVVPKANATIRADQKAKDAADDADYEKRWADYYKRQYEQASEDYSKTPLAKVKEAASSAKDKASDAIDKVKGVASTAKDKVSDAANTVRKKGRDALGITAKEDRDKAYADMVRASRDAGRAQIRAINADQSEKGAAEYEANYYANRWAPLFKHAYERASSKYSKTPLGRLNDAKSSAKDKASDAIDKVKGAADSAKEKVKDTYDKARFTAGDTYEKARFATAQAAEKAKDLYDKARFTATDTVEKAKDKMSNISDSVKDKASEVSDTIKDYASYPSNAINKAKGAVSSTFEKVKGAAESARASANATAESIKAGYDSVVSSARAVGIDVSEYASSMAALTKAEVNYRRVMSNSNSSSTDRMAAKQALNNAKRSYNKELNDVLSYFNNDENDKLGSVGNKSKSNGPVKRSYKG